MYTKVSSGVPQGGQSFSFYMCILINIIRKPDIDVHCYADNTHPYLSFKPKETNVVAKFQACLKDIKMWMTYNFFALNSSH